MHSSMLTETIKTRFNLGYLKSRIKILDPKEKKFGEEVEKKIAQTSSLSNRF